MILVSFFIGWFISVGPTVLYLNTKSFFANTGNHPIIFNDKTYIYKEPIQKAEMIVDYYQKGLFAYTFTPANNGSHFFYPSATLMFPLNWFFWIGMGIILVNRKNRFNNVVLAVVLLFTLFSQVLVNGIGATHRLQGIVPFLNIIAFIGLWSFSKKIIKDPILRNKLIIIFTAIFYLSQIYIFFGSRIADIYYEKEKVKEYVFQFALNNIANDPPDVEYYILNKYPYNINLFLYIDKIEYMTNPKKVKIVDVKNFNELLKDSLVNKSGITRKFITFNKYKSLPVNLIDKIPPQTEATYKCNQNILGILWDCPKDFTGYTYYYYEIE